MAVTRMSKSSIRDFTKFNEMSGGALYSGSAGFLVIAGGGAGGDEGGGGGGAGGYRTSEGTSGGGAGAESPLSFVSGDTWTVTVGAGGSSITNGSNSVFGTITSLGGGAQLATGGSGGGTRRGYLLPGSGTAGQGYDGALGTSPYGGGGGGAGEAGETDGERHGGDGVASSITGSSVVRAGGGAGGWWSGSGDAVGGDGGGGDGGTSAGVNGSPGTVNTGGGGGAGAAGATGGSGGSGIVIFAVPSGFSVSFSGGVTQTSTAIGDNIVYTVTATSTTSETVTIS